jgi:hypothetical protein
MNWRKEYHNHELDSDEDSNIDPSLVSIEQL